MTMESLAKLMFDRYNATGPNPGKSWDGKPVPPWEECGEQVRGKWIAAAMIAADAVRAELKGTESRPEE